MSVTAVGAPAPDPDDEPPEFIQLGSALALVLARMVLAHHLRRLLEKRQEMELYEWRLYLLRREWWNGRPR